MYKIGVALAVFTTAIHIFIGTYDTLLPFLRASELSPAITGAMHACWHMVSIFLAYSSWVFWKARPSSKNLAIIWILSALIFVFIGLYQGGLQGLIVLPQWSLLALCGGLILIGERRRRQDT